jgi:hypothetical protein
MLAIKGYKGWGFCFIVKDKRRGRNPIGVFFIIKHESERG